ncbi:MAG: serine hydroxymethyltransferase [Candidatus Atribacteria bacterium]|nr:serine hydroxymethyltransferase [Candidatus Atribacteria bacterium]
MEKLKVVDPEIASLVEKEMERQVTNIELIASANFVYESVLEGQGSVLTNKIVEGYPGKRYYAGCEYIDEIEKIAIERAKEIFGAEHANVQPHSGVNANMAAYMALLEPGDTILGMDLQCGGHLSHGSKISITGKYYNGIHYKVNKETELIDYDEVETLGLKYKPKLIIAGGSAYPRQIDWGKFKETAKKIGAYFVVDMAHITGLVAAGVHPSPIPYADIVTGTTYKTMRGAKGGIILCKEEFAKKVDKAVFPGVQGSILLHEVLAKAITFGIAKTKEYKKYQIQVVKNAKRMADYLIKHNIRLVSGGTDTHLILVDLRSLKITGIEAENALYSVGITVNRNRIPYDPEPPTIASGIRIGTAAITSTGFIEEDIDEISDILVSVLKGVKKGFNKEEYRKRVLDLCIKHPLYLDSLELAELIDRKYNYSDQKDRMTCTNYE